MQPRDSVDTTASGPSAGRFALLFVVILFAFALAVTIFLWIANSTLSGDIDRARAESADLDASIAKVRSDRDVQAYEYYAKAKGEVDRAVRLSMAQQYLSDFMDLSRRYDIAFYGFSFANDRVTTSARSENLGDVRRDAVEKISAMVRDFRTHKDASLFLLGPVLAVNGTENQREFGISFSVNESAVLSRSGATAASGSTRAPLAPAAPIAPAVR